MTTAFPVPVEEAEGTDAQCEDVISVPGALVSDTQGETVVTVTGTLVPTATRPGLPPVAATQQSPADDLGAQDEHADPDASRAESSSHSQQRGSRSSKLHILPGLARLWSGNVGDTPVPDYKSQSQPPRCSWQRLPFWRGKVPILTVAVTGSAILIAGAVMMATRGSQSRVVSLHPAPSAPPLPSLSPPPNPPPACRPYSAIPGTFTSPGSNPSWVYYDAACTITTRPVEEENLVDQLFTIVGAVLFVISCCARWCCAGNKGRG